MWLKSNKTSESNNTLILETILKQYEAIFQNTEDAIFLIEVQEEKYFKFLQTNKSHQERTGITPEMIINKTPKELLGDVLGDLIENNYKRCVEERNRIEYIETLNLPAGTRTWKTTLTPVFDENNKVVYIVGISYDITIQENYIRELGKTNQKLNSILETSPDGIAIIDLLGNFKFASEKILDMLEIPYDNPNNLIGQNIKNFLPHKTYEQFNNNISILINRGSLDKANVYEFPSKDGKPRLYEIQSKVLKEDEGYANSILIIARDVTERILIELEKEKSKKIYQTLFDMAPSGILLLDEDGIIIDANNAFTLNLGYSRNEIIGKHCLTICKEDEENQISKNIERIKNGENLVHEVRHTKPDGSIVHFLLNERLIELYDNQKAILSISNNITELREKEKKLKESELLFRTVSDYSFDWIFLIDSKPSIKYMSPSVEKITGYKQSDFENYPMLFIEIIHPDDRPHYLSKHKFENNNYDFASEPETTLEFRIITKDGSIKYISHSCVPIYDQDGNFYGRRITNRDITPIIKENLKLNLEK